MIVFVASVHHTGTQFTMDMLVRNGFKNFERQVPPDNQAYRGNSVHRQHISIEHFDKFQEVLTMKRPLIVPLRHPKLCAQSWANRRRSIDVMLQQWNWLIDIVAPYKPLYLPVDSPDKNTYLERIAERLGVPLSTEWPIVGSKPCSYAPYDETKVDDFVRSAKFKDTLGSIY